MTETIYALASGAGRAAIAVFRISGPASGHVLAHMAGAPPPPRRLALRSIRDEASLLDEAIVVWLPAPATYTGEDMAELHVHGGPAVIEEVASCLARLGARAALPGEFTRRAVLNGKMDLLAAEAVGDLIEAETEKQRQQALRQRGGALSALYGGWRRRVIESLARVEAIIDFGEEDDVREGGFEADPEPSRVAAEIEAHLDDDGRGERLRSGLIFAVVGAPNVGKTSLVNAMAGRPVGIVSTEPGTTRDVLEARLDLGGIPVTLLDTAGLREAEGDVERQGVQRTLDRARRADALIRVAAPGLSRIELDPVESQAVLDVITKADLDGAPEHAVSALTGKGLSGLRDAMTGLAHRLAGLAEAPSLTRARHRRSLSDAAAHLRLVGSEDEIVLRADSLRRSRARLDALLGGIDSEAVLAEIFGRFCIGK